MSEDMINCWSKFRDLLLDLQQRFIPLKKVHKNGHKRKAIWTTNKVLRSVDRKSKVYKKYKDKDHPAVQTANRTAAKEIKKAKRNFEKKLAQNIKHDSKSFFAYTRSKTKSKIQAGAILSDSDTKTAQRFNEYFSSVFTAENTSTLPIPKPLESQQKLSSFCDLQFDVESVHKVLSKLRPNKAMGPDGLASMLLIETQELITYPLYLLFKKSLKDTVIPDDWKQVIVTPIFKKGNRNKADNYRPVSLTSIIGKTFEAIIRDALVRSAVTIIVVTIFIAIFQNFRIVFLSRYFLCVWNDIFARYLRYVSMIDSPPVYSSFSTFQSRFNHVLRRT